MISRASFINNLIAFYEMNKNESIHIKYLL